MAGQTSKLRLVPASGAELSDDELMERARRGYPGAFDALVTRHQARMLRVAARLMGDQTSAADAVQNAFVELFCALDRYQACGKLKSYLYRLLLNQCRHSWRRERSALRFLMSIASHAEPRKVPAPNGFDLDVERSLAKLPEQQRAAVLLHYAGGLTQQEIADALEIPVGTVKSRIFEAMGRIRQSMEVP